MCGEMERSERGPAFDKMKRKKKPNKTEQKNSWKETNQYIQWMSVDPIVC